MSRHEQPVLPGLEFVGSRDLVEAVAAGATAFDEAELVRRAVLQQIYLTQDTAWELFCAQTLASYEATWNLAVSFARDATPVQCEEKKTRWCFGALVDAEAGKVALSTTLTLVHGQTPESEAAFAHLMKPKTGRRCPEQLLGVPAEGSGRSRSIPQEKLVAAYSQRCIDAAYYLDGGVEAAVPGSLQPPKTLHAVGLRAETYLPKRRGASEHRYVWPEHAPHFLERPYTSDRLLTAILNSLNSPTTREKYVTLQRINEILAISAPEVNGAPEMVPPPTILAATLRYQTS